MLKYLCTLCFILLSYSASQETDECRCVTYYLCINGTIITDGGTLVDERFGEIFGKPCRCQCPKDQTCCRLKNATTTSVEPPKKKCGFRNSGGVGSKIGVNTNDVNFGEFPWMVGILVDSGAYRCGGSLIHPSVVLTAAHCVLRNNTYIARAGEWDSSGTTEILKHQDLRVASIKIHEDYYPAQHYNDIALLFLSGSFNLEASQEHISPVCLPPPDAPLNNKRCYVTGWGKDRFGVKGQFPSFLKKIDLPLVEKSLCQTNLRQTNKLGQYFNLHDSVLCAGGEKDKDACLGDGGGPLVCPIPGAEERYQQVGIVSWGIGCNQENVPGVYANVQFFREWIDKEMKNRNLEPSQYQY